MKKNCWEFMNCGRSEKGNMVSEFGVCPVTQQEKHSGINGGKNAGRVCWSITGTLCRNTINGRFAREIKSCMVCPFLESVRKEQSEKFTLVAPKGGRKKITTSGRL